MSRSALDAPAPDDAGAAEAAHPLHERRCCKPPVVFANDELITGVRILALRARAEPASDERARAAFHRSLSNISPLEELVNL